MSCLVTVLTITLAAAAAGAALWQGLLLRRSLGTDALLRLDERWNSDPMNGCRDSASSALLAGVKASDDNAALDEVLDFFEGVALLMRRRVIDKFVAGHFFYWPIASYCAKSQDYIHDGQSREGKSLWKDLEWALSTMKEIEARESERPIGSVGPSTQQIQEFLESETKGETA